MNLEKSYKNITIFFGFFLLFFLIYSFDYSLGWGMNLMYPNIYFFTTGKGNSGYHPFIWNENGFIEIIQVVILFFVLMVLIRILVNKNNSKPKIIKKFIVLSFFGVSYIFFEEISWGQQLINFKSPEIFTDKNSLLYNKQGEFNLHNVSNLFNEIPRAIILIWCSLSIPLLNATNYVKNDQLIKIIKPNQNLVYLSYAILIISIPDFIINKFDLIDNSKLLIFDNIGFVKYDSFQLLISILSLNFIKFSELQELLFFYYFLFHSLFLSSLLELKK